MPQDAFSKASRYQGLGSIDYLLRIQLVLMG